MDSVDRHGNPFTEGWIPASPVLRGETRTPDGVPDPQGPETVLPDELPHRERALRGLTGDDPDPGYDPDADDLLFNDDAPGGGVL